MSSSYIKLDKNEILKEAKKINNPLEDDISKIVELLGGEEKLNEIFAKEPPVVRIIIMTLKNEGKIHVDLRDDGLDILEGLLNKEIVGDLGYFYLIKPDYILSLSQEQQKKLAKSFSEGEKDLEEILIRLWENGIYTHTCDGAHVIESTGKEKDINSQMVGVAIKPSSLQEEYIYGVLKLAHATIIEGWASDNYNNLILQGKLVCERVFIGGDLPQEDMYVLFIGGQNQVRAYEIFLNALKGKENILGAGTVEEEEQKEGLSWDEIGENTKDAVINDPQAYNEADLSSLIDKWKKGWRGND